MSSALNKKGSGASNFTRHGPADGGAGMSSLSFCELESETPDEIVVSLSPFLNIDKNATLKYDCKMPYVLRYKKIKRVDFAVVSVAHRLWGPDVVRLERARIRVFNSKTSDYVYLWDIYPDMWTESPNGGATYPISYPPPSCMRLEDTVHHSQSSSIVMTGRGRNIVKAKAIAIFQTTEYACISTYEMMIRSPTQTNLEFSTYMVPKSNHALTWWSVRFPTNGFLISMHRYHSKEEKPLGIYLIRGFLEDYGNVSGFHPISDHPYIMESAYDDDVALLKASLEKEHICKLADTMTTAHPKTLSCLFGHLFLMQNFYTVVKFHSPKERIAYARDIMWLLMRHDHDQAWEHSIHSELVPMHVNQKTHSMKRINVYWLCISMIAAIACCCLLRGHRIKRKSS